MKTRVYNKKGSWKVVLGNQVLAKARTYSQAKRELDELKNIYDNLQLIPDKNKISLQSLSKTNYFTITSKKKEGLRN